MSGPVAYTDVLEPDPGRLGRVPGLPDPEYRADPGVSNSQLKEIVKSPMHLRYIKRPDTAALSLGRAVHLNVFEPDVDLKKKFASAPNARGYKSMSTKSKPNLTWDRLAGGNPNEKDIENNPEVEDLAEKVRGGAALVLHDALDDVRIIATAVRGHPLLQEPLSEGIPEVSYFAEEADGIRVKCRIDWETRPRHPLVLDLKTAANASLEGEQNWWSAVRKWNYDQQRVFYARVMFLAGNPPADFEFIVPDKPAILGMYAEGIRDPEKLSEGVARYSMGKEQIEAGEVKVSKAMEKLRESNRSGIEGFPRDVYCMGTDVMEDF